jgi:hypothetical protein
MQATGSKGFFTSRVIDVRKRRLKANVWNPLGIINVAISYVLDVGNWHRWLAKHDGNQASQDAARNGRSHRSDRIGRAWDRLPTMWLPSLVDANDPTNVRYGLAAQDLPELWPSKEDHRAVAS